MKLHLPEFTFRNEKYTDVEYEILHENEKYKHLIMLFKLNRFSKIVRVNGDEYTKFKQSNYDYIFNQLKSQ